MNTKRPYINPHYNDRVARFRLDSKREVDVLFLGDSLIERYDLASYFPQWKTANRGVDGDTVEGAYNRLTDSLDVNGLKAIVILIGINDIPAAELDYPYLLAKVKSIQPKVPIFVLSLLPVGGIYADINESAKRANGKLATIASSFGATYLDVRKGLEDEDGELKEDYTVDGIHLSRDGYQVLTDALTPILKEAL